MRADIHDGSEHMLQSEAGYIDARPHQPGSTNPSCTARPDHTMGQTRTTSLGVACPVSRTADMVPRESWPGSRWQWTGAPARVAGLCPMTTLTNPVSHTDHRRDPERVRLAFLSGPGAESASPVRYFGRTASATPQKEKTLQEL